MWYPFRPASARKIDHGIEAAGGPGVDQSFLGHVEITPVLADADRILAAQATSASAITEIINGSFLAQPDVARVVEVLPGGTTADVPAGDVTIEGHDINGHSITDTLTFAANAVAKQVSVKAFAHVRKITFPIQDGAGATYDVGVGVAIGMPATMKDATMALVKLFDGSADAGSFVLDATDPAKNVYTAAGTFDGAKVLDIWAIIP